MIRTLLGPTFRGTEFGASMNTESVHELADKVGTHFSNRSDHKHFCGFAVHLVRFLCEKSKEHFFSNELSTLCNILVFSEQGAAAGTEQRSEQGGAVGREHPGRYRFDSRLIS